MIFIEETDSLAHYGVMGMKWGVRKDGKPQGYQGGGTRGKSSVEKHSSGIPYKANRNASIDQDMAVVNKNGSTAPGRTSNCAYCTAAYDLRRRGLDVEAGKTPIGVNSKIIEEWYPGAKEKRVEPTLKVSNPNDPWELMTVEFTDPERYSKATKEHVENTKKEILSQGDGARGSLLISWDLGGGHAMAYEVENGKVVVVDAQSNAKMPLEKAMANANPAKPARVTRLDKTEPDLSLMTKHGIVTAKGVKSEKLSRSERKEMNEYINSEAKKIYNETHAPGTAEIKSIKVTKNKVKPADKLKPADNKAFYDAIDKALDNATKKYSQTAVHRLDAQETQATIRQGIAITTALIALPVATMALTEILTR